MIVQIGLLIICFILLIKGADIFVEGASKVAIKFNIPQIVVGLTIVAFGTSAPEAAISIGSAMKGNVGLAVGNVIGSNIMNVLLILGITGCIAVTTLKKNTYRYEMPFVALITAVFMILGYFGGSINFVDGIILWAIFICFLYYLFRLVKSGQEQPEEIEEVDANDTYFKLIAMIVLGMAAIVYGSDLTVDAASTIASDLGISERIIGLTIVAFGTSLPELITSVTAALKGKNDISVGNIIGSNIFNILFVLGTTALVSPVAVIFDPAFLFDGFVAIGALVLFFVYINKKMELRKSGAILMLVAYAAYFINLL